MDASNLNGASKCRMQTLNNKLFYNMWVARRGAERVHTQLPRQGGATKDLSREGGGGEGPRIELPREGGVKEHIHGVAT